MSGGRNPVSRVEDAPPPPYTETDIYSNPSAPSHDGDASHVSSATSGEPILTPPASPIAGSYFETRPVSSVSSGPFMVHHITVGPDTLPEHVPYNAGLAMRDVTEQDWATFKNYLLPDHTLRMNDAVVERKLRDEARSEDGTSTKSGKSHAEAPLGRIHNSSEAGGEERMDAAQLRDHAITTVQEWNTSFFGPRGVTIRLNPLPQEAESGRMPGAWESNFSERSGGPQVPEPARAGWRGYFDRVKVTDNMIRIGDSFIADDNGLKIGSLVMDGRGIRMDGSQPQADPDSSEDPARRGFGRGSRADGFSRGPRRGGWGGRGGPGFGAHPQHPLRGGERGRSFGEGPSTGPRQRSHSVSSISSSSSSSSSESDSSLDDLPDYDDLAESQMPVYADRLENWVKNPETIRTKQDLADLREELKTVKRAGLDPDVDQKALKKQVKALRAQWKGVRKEQKRVLKEKKRERRSRRRAERRERRERKKEVKRAEREMGRERREGRKERRECRREGREGRHGGGGQWPSLHAAAGAPGVAGIPGVSAMSNPPAPPAPHAAWGRGSWGGMFGNRGLFGPQGSFGPQVSYPSFPNGRPLAYVNIPSFLHKGPFGGQGASGPPPPPEYLNSIGTNPAPPGSWPEDVKVQPEEFRADESRQEAGVMEASGREQRLKELEGELEKKIMALEGLDEGKQRKEGEKEIEALLEKLDGLRIEVDEAYAKELAGHT